MEVFTYGKDPTLQKTYPLEEADRSLQAHKNEREVNGEWASRGNEPPGLSEASPEGNESRDQREDVHEEVGNGSNDRRRKISQTERVGIPEAKEDFKAYKREVEQKFKEPGGRPFEKKVVRLAYYRHIKNLYQRGLKRANRQHEDSPELFRRFCKFRTDWLRAKGKKQATLKYLGLLERRTP